MIRRTPAKHILPILGRLAITAAGIIGKAFVDAHLAEIQKTLRKEFQKQASSSYPYDEKASSFKGREKRKIHAFFEDSSKDHEDVPSREPETISFDEHVQSLMSFAEAFQILGIEFESNTQRDKCKGAQILLEEKYRAYCYSLNAGGVSQDEFLRHRYDLHEIYMKNFLSKKQLGIAEDTLRRWLLFLRFDTHTTNEGVITKSSKETIVKNIASDSSKDVSPDVNSHTSAAFSSYLLAKIITAYRILIDPTFDPT